MRTAFLCIVALANFFPGCSPTKAGISDQPVPDNGIYIAAAAEVNSPSNTGRAPFTAYCLLQYADTSKSSADFNSAKVTANGIALARVYSDGNFQSMGSSLQFEEGDSLEFVIKHQNVGTVRGVVRIPPSVSGVSVTPGLSTANLPNSETTFTLHWISVPASYYLVEAAGFNYWQTMLVADSVFGTVADSATIVLIDSSGGACPWVYFRVRSINFVPIPGFASGSGFTVTGAYYMPSSNMPNVGANEQTMRFLRK